MNDDEIFAAIALYQSARAIWQTPKYTDHTCAVDAVTSAWDVLLKMAPTTMAGFDAKLRALKAEDIIDRDDLEGANIILRTIYRDFAALAAAQAQPTQPAAA
jgi:hypothetical protein